MSEQFWPEWAQHWQHHPLKGFLLSFLEGTGPFRLLVGQFMLAGTVFVDPTKTDRWLAAVEILEDDGKSRAFASMLKEENPR